ncbi:MAG TPA: diacylglycerol kinase [Desulfurivibrionaceae bacterium]|nr:diacylglycerol kinase [Desulfurivibrionaceae bacterium]
MAKASGNGLGRIMNAWGWSLQGLRAAFRHEAAFRQELMATVVLLPLGLWLGNNGIEKTLLAGSLLLVLIVELLNSAVEAVVDRIGPDHHELAGRAKDLGSAAVLLAIATTLLTWFLVLHG